MGSEEACKDLLMPPDLEEAIRKLRADMEAMQRLADDIDHGCIGGAARAYASVIYLLDALMREHGIEP